jgi:hypothetical protein
MSRRLPIRDELFAKAKGLVEPVRDKEIYLAYTNAMCENERITTTEARLECLLPDYGYVSHLATYANFTGISECSLMRFE